jgi:hypothetical protein
MRGIFAFSITTQMRQKREVLSIICNKISFHLQHQTRRHEVHWTLKEHNGLAAVRPTPPPL